MLRIWKEVRKENDKLGKGYDGNDGEEKGYVDISEFMIFDETLEAMDLFSNIESRLIYNWDLMYEKYKEYIKTHEITGYKDYNNKEIGLWVQAQRQSHKLNTLSIEKIKLLDEINFIWGAHDYTWEKKYYKLKDFYLKNGHTNITEKENKELGEWVTKQRSKYAKNKLNNERIKKLELLNFDWNRGFKIYHEVWFDKYEQLKELYDEHGSVEIVNENTLKLWVQTQRSHYRKNILEKEKVKKLNDINFRWEYLDDIWDEKYYILCEYKKEFGSCLAPVSMLYKNTKLGGWINEQRIRYKQNKLSQERIDKLNSIGFVWFPLKFKNTNLSKYHLKNLLKEGDINAKELGILLNINHSSIIGWNNNKCNISKKHVSTLANYFNIEQHLLQPQKGDGCVK